MKIVCISRDHILIERFNKHPFFSSVTSLEELSHLKLDFEDFDCLVLSDLQVSVYTLPYIREVFSQAHIFYLLSRSPYAGLRQKLETMCYANDIQPIHPRKTREQIVSYVVNSLRQMEKMEYEEAAYIKNMEFVVKSLINSLRLPLKNPLL